MPLRCGLSLLRVGRSVFLLESTSLKRLYSGRAVDDKVASDLLGESFRRTLQLDGSLSRLTFVTTRSDDVSPREAARSIPSLREELEPLEEEQDELTAEKKASGLVTKAAKAELATAIEALK